MKPSPARLELLSYPYTVDIASRFADIDPLWHLNNVRIVEIYQEGRVSFNRALWEEFNIEWEREHDRRVVVAHQSLDYLGEVTWPDSVCVAVGVSHIGNTSFSLGLGLFQRGKCVGISDVVLVHMTAEGPARLSDRAREALASQLLPAPTPATPK